MDGHAGARGVSSRSSAVRARHRHVILPKHIAKQVQKGKLLSEAEWRGLGVQQSRGWVHYCIHKCARPPRHGFERAPLAHMSHSTYAQAGASYPSLPPAPRHRPTDRAC